MKRNRLIDREELSRMFEELANTQRNVYLTFHRENGLKDIPFRIATFDTAGDLVTAISDAQQLAVQFVVEDVQHAELPVIINNESRT